MSLKTISFSTVLSEFLNSHKREFLFHSRNLNFDSTVSKFSTNNFGEFGSLKMVLTNFKGSGVGFGIGAGCGFGIGWGFGGSPVQFMGLGVGGGCGVGIGLGWGFGAAYGAHYVNSKLTFEGINFEKLNPAQKNEDSE